MEELFNLGREGLERTDINLWIFPHLAEIMAIDLRWGSPKVAVLEAENLFGDSFFSRVEQGFSQILRERTEYPFAHLIDLPVKVEELIRETGMMAILDKLGHQEGEGEFPTLAVFIVSGAALSMTPEQIGHACRSILGDEADPAVVLESSNFLETLMAKEHGVVKRIDREELREALEDQSPNFFTLWDRRN